MSDKVISEDWQEKLKYLLCGYTVKHYRLRCGDNGPLEQEYTVKGIEI
ncbi:hypothetical protein [Bartonella queenslandensis]|nr:hypothetical protein [Bartonella queenslandensis]